MPQQDAENLPERIEAALAVRGFDVELELLTATFRRDQGEYQQFEITSDEEQVRARIVIFSNRDRPWEVCLHGIKGEDLGSFSQDEDLIQAIAQHLGDPDPDESR